uniref:Putative helicase n=1 Tax=Pichia etchellsii TaxID=28550 RepID=Q9HFH7_PICET|nr:putative helicase [Schwanniomyces etchellsii]
MDILHYSFLDRYGLITTFEEQNHILSYLHPENPYKSLIVCYKVGVGKTYASALLAHIYLVEGFSVLYLSNSLNSIATFKQEYKKALMDSRVKSLIHNIDFMTFTKIFNNGCKDKYGLIIIDEVHNLRENANRYNKIKSILKYLKYPKILIMTATPMIDDTNELDSIIKLSGEENPKILFSKKSNDNDINIKYIGNKINGETLYTSVMKGIQLENYKKSLLSNNNYVYTNTRQSSISSSSYYDPNIPLKEQSSKIYRFMQELDYKSTTVVFCFYVKRGIDFLVSVLNHYGYKPWNINSKGKTYAVIDGNSTSSYTEEVLKAFNSIANYNGSIINILIGSSVLSESVTLFRVKHLHILSPFWNYGQIEQSIGRATRYGSHYGSKNNELNIYLHAACENDYLEGKDIDMWKISHEKKNKINERLKQEMDTHKINVTDHPNFIYPEPDDKLIFRVGNTIWDLTNCFDHNVFKISWCNISYENVVGYNLDKKIKIIGSKPNGLKINFPLPNGYTIWRSCIDDKLRISYISNIKKKYNKRGKIFSNMNFNEIKIISKDLGCLPNSKEIINTLKSQNRYFDKQIEYDI